MTPATPTLLKIDFVSDIVCPWCAIGLAALAQAAERLAGQVRLDWHFQPFELNPGMGPQGEDLFEHLDALLQLQEVRASLAAGCVSLLVAVWARAVHNNCPTCASPVEVPCPEGSHSESCHGHPPCPP